jgi:hypothetical protein
MLFFSRNTFAQKIVINEFMSSNYSALKDEDGATSDWLELFNNNNNSIDLDGYYLSDDRNDLTKWQFTNSVLLEPNDFLLVFASGKDKHNYAKVWNTEINQGDTWKYKIGTSEPEANWKDNDFDDSDWDSGDSGFGYGDDDDQTVVPEGTISIYLRREFNIENLDDVSALLLHIDFDDGFVAYINGIEIARANLGSPNEFVPFDMLAKEPLEANMFQDKLPSKFVINNYSDVLVNGKNVLTIQVHNADATSSDLTAIPFLTIGYKNDNGKVADVPEIISSNLDFLHTNFKISSSGETIYLSNAEQIIIDSIPSIPLRKDMSFGRKPDGANDFYMFENSTPSSSNITAGFKEITEDPAFSLSERMFNSPQYLSFINSANNLEIYYTTNGEEPDKSKNLYTTPILINTTTVIKAKAYKENFLPSNTATQTFLINENTNLPIVSLSTEPYNFWDADSGIYVMGPNADSEYPFWGANFWQKWERPIHVEFMDKDGTLQLEQDAGVKIYGQWSRANAQKSLALHARKKYGAEFFNYKFFSDVNLEQFRALVLRNSGNDWGETMFRDGFMQSLTEGLDIDRLAFRPSVVFLNGEYWGIHNLREKINKTYVATHHNIDKNNIDLLEGYEEVIAGDDENYKELRRFIKDEDLSIEENYEYVKTQIDIDNFINYNLIEIYIANTDWPSNNVKYWRPRTPEGKWRWILYDTDFGFQFADTNTYAHNTLEFALEENGPDWPNPSWATLNLRKLIENENFKNKFVNHFADFRNSIFKPEVVKNRIAEFKTKIESEIDRHIEKWHAFTHSKWEQNINILTEFANQRLDYLTQYFAQRFELTELKKINLNVFPKNAGEIILNSLTIKNFPWQGEYFSNIPIQVTIHANNGYRFVRWEGDFESNEKEITIAIDNEKTLTAVFEKIENYKEDVVINEINYDSSPNFDTEDWVEIYNNTDNDIDLSNWILKDKKDKDQFKFPEGTIIHAKEYLVICRDTTAFTNLFNNQEGYGVTNYIGNFKFGLSSKGEMVRLLNSNGEIIDSLIYDDVAPWPTAPKGNGPTLELKNPKLDNRIATNWESSSNHGTPGKQNDSYIVGIKKDGKDIPVSFKLYQNYPNPFNPTTTIKYSLPIVDAKFAFTTNVTLKVYDVLGKEIAILVNKNQKPGSYTVEFNANKLSSGIYFYKLRSGSFTKIQKMILLK